MTFPISPHCSLRTGAMYRHPARSRSQWFPEFDGRRDMAKNVVVCCDGTAYEFAADRTNVAKLFFTLVKDPACQVCYYHPGVGTMAPPGVLTKTGAFLTRMAGMAWGYGLNSDIRDAYIFIANNFEEGDQLFLFGFSRG